MAKSNKKTLTKYQGDRGPSTVRNMDDLRKERLDSYKRVVEDRLRTPPPPERKGITKPGKYQKSSPTGPDYVGPYSIYGTAGPVNETISKVRDTLNAPPQFTPMLKLMHGGQLRRQASVNGLRTSRKHK